MSGFGSFTTTTSSLPAFGSTATPAVAATPSFGSFGSAATGTAAPATGFGSFGSAAAPSTPAPTTGFGSFGSTAASPAAGSTGFGSFGTSTAAPATGTATGTTGFGSFGSTAAAPAAGTTTASTGFGGFGAAATPSATAGSGFGFGAAPAATTATATAGFGAAATASTSSFGAAFGTAPAGLAQTQTQTQAQRPTGPIIDAIERLQRLYAPLRDTATGQYVATSATGTRNEECRFKAVMLNRRTAGAQQSAQLVYGDLLAQAERDNTDPEHFVAAEELGSTALRTRFESQEQEAQKLREHGEKIADLLRVVREANQQLHARFDLLKNKQALINKRVLSVMRKVEVLRCHGTPLQQSELVFRDRLIKMLQAIEAPMQKMQDVSISLTLQEVPQEMYADDVSEEDLLHLISALKKQSESIESLTATLRKDVRDISIVRANLAAGKH